MVLGIQMCDFCKQVIVGEGFTTNHENEHTCWLYTNQFYRQGSAAFGNNTEARWWLGMNDGEPLPRQITWNLAVTSGSQGALP